MAIKELLDSNTSKVLEATELLKALSDREGQYVWKKLTAKGGDFIDFVVADSENSYPNYGELDGYWYELVNMIKYTSGTEDLEDGVTPLDENTFYFVTE